MKQIWILAGGNGSGKTTFYNNYLKPRNIPFVNADEIKKAHGIDDAEAQKAAHGAFQEMVSRGESFCYETVFSHP